MIPARQERAGRALPPLFDRRLSRHASSYFVTPPTTHHTPHFHHSRASKLQASKNCLASTPVLID